jgi:hypothetical protein
VRFAPDDWSSIVSYSIFRPFTPPSAFCRAIRASKPLMPFCEIYAAAPVAG